MKMPYSVARLLASIAEDEANQLGVPMAIALADAEGGLMLFGRMDGALPAGTELAVSKAFSAAVLRMPTDHLGKLAQPGGALYGIEQSHQGRIVLFGGGLPLRLGGRPAGAIGISGGTVEQDMVVARAAVEALQQMEQWADVIAKHIAWSPGAVAPAPSKLERMLQADLERTGHLLSSRGATVLTGAILLAGARGQQE